MPPTALDTAERFLGRAVVSGLIILVLAIAGSVYLSHREQARVAKAAAAPAPSTIITFAVDFGNGYQRRYNDLKFTPGMTVLDAMHAVESHPQAPKFTISGSGETAFVSEIDGVRNQGAGDLSRNWQFWVNTDFAHRSAGATPIKPGDRIVWTFEVWKQNPTPPRS